MNTSLFLAIGSIVFNPLFWNLVARYEYHHRGITKLMGGNSYAGCYALGLTIFLLGVLRDYLFHNALLHQPTSETLLNWSLRIPLSGLLFLLGGTLVISSMWALGITGTYLGDYFGILMKEKVTGFPFNLTNNPMYNGSTLMFLATSLWHSSLVGFYLTILVHIGYLVALRFEEPFTEMIYTNAATAAATARTRKGTVEETHKHSQ